MRAARLLAVLLAAVAVLPAAAAARRHHRHDRIRTCNGEVRLCGRRLSDVVLPATHNAMSAASLGWKIPN
jgi:hypothetical protein